MNGFPLGKNAFGRRGGILISTLPLYLEVSGVLHDDIRSVIRLTRSAPSHHENQSITGQRTDPSSHILRRPPSDLLLLLQSRQRQRVRYNYSYKTYSSLLYIVSLGVYVSSFAKDLVCTPRPYSPPVIRLCTFSSKTRLMCSDEHSSQRIRYLSRPSSD